MLRSSLALLFTVGVLSAQTGEGVRPRSSAAEPLPEFEVASVRPIDPAVPHLVGVHIFPGARVVISALPLKTLVMIAFHLSYWQVTGGGWIEKDGFDIEAKPQPSSRPRIHTLRFSNYGIEDEHLRQLLQALLIDRFRLRFHRETRIGTTYVLQTKGGPLRLRRSQPTPAGSESSQGSGRFSSIGFAAARWGIFDSSMAQLAKFASDNIVHAPVADGTALTGSFDYRQPAPLPDSEVNYSDYSESFLRLLPEMGLKLERTKGPVEILVIDHAEPPSPN